MVIAITYIEKSIRLVRFRLEGEVAALAAGTHDCKACITLNTECYEEGKLRLDESQPSAAEARMRRLKASSSAAVGRGRQLKKQAEMNADRLETQKTRQKLIQLQRSSVTKPIKPIEPY